MTSPFCYYSYNDRCWLNNHDAKLVYMTGTQFTAGWMESPCLPLPKAEHERVTLGYWSHALRTIGIPYYLISPGGTKSVGIICFPKIILSSTMHTHVKMLYFCVLLKWSPSDNLNVIKKYTGKNTDSWTYEAISQTCAEMIGQCNTLVVSHTIRLYGLH